MGRRSHTRTLGLWMNGARLGTWSLAPNAPDTLQYDLDWAQSEQGRPLSLSLPFTPGNAPHRGEKVRAYFENLLPDSKDIRERLARRFKTGSTDAFELLAEIGRDCVGALEILPDDHASNGAAPVKAEPLTEAQVGEELLAWKSLNLRGLAVATAPGTAPRVEVKETSLVDFFARVTINEAGRINLSDIAKTPAEARAANAASAAASTALRPSGR